MNRRWGTLVIALLAVGVCVGLPAAGQSPASEWIQEIEIVSLAPLEVAFEFANEGIAVLGNIEGRATLSDQFGQTIEVYRIDPFTVPGGQRQEVTVQSRWDFQQIGYFLLEIALEPGDGSLISNSLAFQILPIQVPGLRGAPQPVEGLVTHYQKPVSWGLTRIAAPEAWTVSPGRDDVVVAVIDSGIDSSIPQLQGSMWRNPGEIANNGIDDDRNGFIDDVHGWDFRDNDNSSLTGSPLHGHGTFVASIIAAQPGELPIVGVAPGVRLMDVRFLDSSNSFRSRDWDTFARAIDYAVDNGADIINLSIYANGRPPSSLETALDRARQRGVIVVGITGNRGGTEVMYPGRYDSILAISATTSSDLLASFSNQGPGVAFCAPGDDVTAITKGGRASTQSGTSFAAPHVTGVLALILSVAPNLTPDEAIRILADTAIDLGARGMDTQYGQGLIDALAAVLRASR